MFDSPSLSLLAKVPLTAIAGWTIQIVIRRATQYFRLKHLAGPSYTSLATGNFQDTLNDVVLFPPNRENSLANPLIAQSRTDK